MSDFKSFDVAEFEKYIEGLSVKRKIKLIQLHHTFSPSYKNFNGKNHAVLQENMRNYHIKKNGWKDIGQHFTVFPDGIIMTGRSAENAPAGIYGANTGAICIECVGNFDGADEMTSLQKRAIAGAVKILLDKFNLSAKEDVTYHAWWTSGGTHLGTYVKGKSAKTCPGTKFFGGNTKEAYQKNLLPLIEEYKNSENALLPVTKINDIIWELLNGGIITDGSLWTEKCTEDKNIYWLCRKTANKLRGTL